jgi:tetratricopeptide (TPR) repeat protein
MDFSAWNTKGISLAQNGEIEQARLCFQGAIDCDPDSAPAWNNLGNTYYHNEEWEEALPLFLRSIELDPSFEGPYLSAGVCLSNLGYSERSLELYAVALSIIPDSYSIWYNKAHTLVDLNKIPEAIAVFDHLLTLKPREAATLINRESLLEKCSFVGSCVFNKIEENEVVPSHGAIYSWNGLNFITPLVDQTEEEFLEKYNPDEVLLYQNPENSEDDFPDDGYEEEEEEDENPRFKNRWIASSLDNGLFSVTSHDHSLENPGWAEEPDYSNPIIHPYSQEPTYLEDDVSLDEEAFGIISRNGNRYLIDWDEENVVVINPDTLQFWFVEDFLGKKIKIGDILGEDMNECAWLYWKFMEEPEGSINDYFKQFG